MRRLKAALAEPALELTCIQGLGDTVWSLDCQGAQMHHPDGLWQARKDGLPVIP